MLGTYFFLPVKFYHAKKVIKYTCHLAIKWLIVIKITSIPVFYFFSECFTSPLIFNLIFCRTPEKKKLILIRRQELSVRKSWNRSRLFENQGRLLSHQMTRWEFWYLILKLKLQLEVDNGILWSYFMGLTKNGWR